MKPLSKIRVLDFSHGVAGPYGTMILGDLGADVIKIEKPGRGDVTRFLNISERFSQDIPRSGGDYFLTVNRNKRSVALDLGTPDGKALALRMAESADVVVQSFRPGVMERLGLGYEAMRQRNPRIIYASLSAYGAKGPLAGHPGMDVAVQARSGVMSITGQGGGHGPLRPGVSLADFSGGVHLAVAILGGLVAQSRNGWAGELSVSLLDSTMSMLSNYAVCVLDGGVTLQPMGSGHPQIVPYQAFPTADGFVVIATGTNKLFRTLCSVLDLAALAANPNYKTNPDRVRHRKELVEVLSTHTRLRTTTEWLQLFEKNGVPCSPVNTMKQALEDPQLAANDMIVQFDHPVYGPVRTVGSPYKYGTENDSHRRPALLGEHTSEVLRDTLGLSPAELDRLLALGVIHQDHAAATNHA